MKILLVMVLPLLLGVNQCGSAWDKCKPPIAPVIVIDGTVATQEEMDFAIATFKEYDSRLSQFTMCSDTIIDHMSTELRRRRECGLNFNCLEEKAALWNDIEYRVNAHNSAVDEAMRKAELLNKEIRKFKARNKADVTS